MVHCGDGAAGGGTSIGFHREVGAGVGTVGIAASGIVTAGGQLAAASALVRAGPPATTGSPTLLDATT